MSGTNDTPSPPPAKIKFFSFLLKFLQHGIFYCLIIPTTVIIASLGLLLFFTPYRFRYWLITRWSWAYIQFASLFFGLRSKVTGIENLPKQPAIIVANHQSNWETIFMQVLLPPQSWVLKKELLAIPFFGWALALLRPISIQRNQKQSIKHMLAQGEQRIKEGNWIVIYPEGTRLGVDQFKTFSRSAAALALQTNTVIVPIAHNAGLFWPKGPWIKSSGTIDVQIGEPIVPNPLESASQLNKKLEDTIYQMRQAMPPYH